MPVYIEYLSFSSFLSILRKELSFSIINDREVITHYFIDATLFGEKIANIFGRFYGFEFKKLKFRLIDIKDENGELVQIRIKKGDDLINIQQEIINNVAYQKLKHSSWGSNRIEKYIQKSIIDGGIAYKTSLSRFLFIINLVSWHMKQVGMLNARFIVNQRPWYSIYKDYSSQLGIELTQSNKKLLSILESVELIIKGIIKRNIKLFLFIRNTRNGKFVLNNKDNLVNTPLLYLDGRGDVNVNNNGYHSDFFWVLNSDFPPQNVLYDHNYKTENSLFNEFGLQFNERKIIPALENNVKLQINGANGFDIERKTIKSYLESYHATRSYWNSLFHTYNVKVFFTWYKYSTPHIAIGDAIKSYGGISAVWQAAFDGVAFIGGQTFADLIFSYSDYSDKIEKKLNSKYRYNIITGYTRDYAAPLLKKEANILRNKLKKHGAKKIIFAIDENSIDDNRWHPGHVLQRENYSFILEKLIEIPWLGVIFKPKQPKTLRRRLGEINELLVEAERTGRCFIYEDYGRHTTSAPPLLAGLSADVCIHGHLSAGTAALECAFEGIPTLLIDREGCPNSKLYQLPKGKVIFRDWPESIDAVLEHFQIPGGIPGFGDWSEIIDEFDPYRDGKAAYRIGTYLHWLIQGFKEGHDRETIMADAAGRYIEIWGADKVHSN